MKEAPGGDQECSGADGLLALNNDGQEQKDLRHLAALQAVLALKAQVLRAEAPQTDQARFEGQLDD